MPYIVKKDDLYLYKTKPNGYAYFSEKERAKPFNKQEAEELAKKYNAEVEKL